MSAGMNFRIGEGWDVHALVPGAWYVAAGAVSGLVCAALLAPRS